VFAQSPKGLNEFWGSLRNLKTDGIEFAF
jgi:hypothetical protein